MCFQDGNYQTTQSSQSSLPTKVIIHTRYHDSQGQGEYMSWQTRPFSAPVASGSKPASKTENITMNYLSSSENKLNFLTIHQPKFYVLKMLFTLFFCSIYSSALQTRFYHGSKHEL